MVCLTVHLFERPSWLLPVFGNYEGIMNIIELLGTFMGCCFVCVVTSFKSNSLIAVSYGKNIFSFVKIRQIVFQSECTTLHSP